MFKTAREKRKQVRRGRAARRREFMRVEALEGRVLMTAEASQTVVVGPIGPAGWPEQAIQVGTPYLPPSHSVYQAGGYLSAPSTAEPLDIGLSYMRTSAGLFGLTAEDLAQVDVTNNYTDRITGTTHIYLRQMVNGLEVSNALANINIDRFGQVISANSTFVHGLARGEWNRQPVPSITAGQAVSSAAQVLGYKLASAPLELIGAGGLDRSTTLLAREFSQDPIPARLHYVATPDGARLAWNLIAQTPDGQHWYDVSVDAHSGAKLAANDWVDHASYNVFPLPATENPDDGPRQLLVDPQDSIASPFGWHDTDGVAGAEFTDTRGNNVSAQEDTDGNDSGGFRPDGGPGLVFDFPLDLTQAPSAYQSAAISNLFYLNNVLHDVHYQYGFDEISGNFQVNNYGRGGAGGDEVQADAQDGSGINNANFFTPPDGFQPRMQMFLFNLTNPNRDGDLDAGVVTHEYGHGVSNRLTGGPANANALDALQSGGMGEGWSDWYALMFTQRDTDGKNDAYPAGNYVLGLPATAGGIRRVPYSYDMSIDPHTLGTYNISQEVHDAGEIWASVLWDLNWLLIDKYGFDSDLYAGYTGPGAAGNLLALQLVMDGMKLQPANPSFLQARDAILQADQILTGGTNFREIWTAFARRGFGLSAVDGGANSFSVTEAFDTPNFALHVTTTNPAVGSIITTQPTDFTVNFSEEYVPGSVEATDFTVNGLPADSFTPVDNDTIIFHFDATPVVNQGFQTMAIAAGAITRASDNDPIDEFSGQFRYDAVGMQVVSTVPADGSRVSLPLAALQVNFNEPYDPASIDTGDLTLSMGSVTGFSLVDADTVEYTLSGLTSEGTLSIHVAAGAINDTFGNPIGAYDGTLLLDFGTLAYPVPLDAKLPLGSMVYDPGISGTLSLPSDVDSFTLSVDPGQRLTVILNPRSPGLRAKVELVATDVAGSPVVATRTAALKGLDAVIQSYAVAAKPGFPNVARTYMIIVTSVGGTVGDYDLQVVLNAAAETESHNGATNNSRASAQPLNSPTVLYGNASRSAVLGSIDGGTSRGDVFVAVRDPNVGFGGEVRRYNSAGTLTGIIDLPRFDDGFLSDVEIGIGGDLYVALDVGADGGAGELIRFDFNGNYLSTIDLPPDSGPFLLHPFGFDVAKDGTLWVTQPNTGNIVHLTAAGTLIASYFLGGTPEDVAAGTGGIAYVTEPNSGVWRLDTATSTFTPFASGANFFVNVTSNGDVVVSDYNGSVTRYDPSGSPLVSFGTFATADAQNDPSNNYWSASFNGGFLQKNDPSGAFLFQVPLNAPPLGVAVVGVDGGPVPLAPFDSTDHYSFTLAAGQSASVVAESLNGLDVSVALVNSSGTTVAIGHGSATNIGALISDFVATAADTYYVKVTGAIGAQYNLVVTKNASFDSENNGDRDHAQGVVATPATGGNRVALGAITTASGRLFTTPTDGSSTISELDPLTGAEIHRFPAPEFVSAGPDGLAFDGNSLWFINGFGSQVLWELDPDTGAVRSSTIIGSSIYDGIAALDGKIYVEDSAFFDILVFDPATHSVIDVLDIDGTNPGIFAIGGIAGIHGPNRIVGMSNFGVEIIEIDPSTGVVTSSFPTSSTYYGLAVDDGELYLGSPIGSIDVFSRAGGYLRTIFPGYGVSALGGDDLGSGPDPDVYEISANAGATIRVETLTPGGGPGEFVNLLDPMVRILDASGNVVATNDNGAADGRNALASYRVPGGGGGTFYIEVLPSDLTPEATLGEYVLKVRGTNGTLPDFLAVSSDPSDGATLRFAPNQIIINFNDNVLLTTLQASDLTVDGIPASLFTVLDGNTVAFFPAGSFGDGSHTIEISAGALKDTQGTPISAFSSQFTLDQTPPVVIASSIQQGDLLPSGTLEYTVTFSEPMNSTDLDIFDILAFGQFRGNFIRPDFAFYDITGTVLTMSFSNLPDDSYSIALTSGDGAFEDVVGNNLDGEPLAWPIPPNTSGDGFEGGDFFVTFSTDAGAQGLPVPLVAVNPKGSLIYESPSPATGTIVFGGDTDDFTIDLDAGQTLTVLVETTSSLQSTIELLDPSLVSIGTRTAPGIFEEAVLQTAPVETAGVYTVRVGALSGLGLYSVRVVVNAAVEDEAHSFTVTNNDIASAQPIDGSFINVGASGRGAVLGTTDIPPGAGFVFETEPNDSAPAAQDLDAETFGIFPDGNITDARVRPHLSVLASGDGTFDYYKFTVNSAGNRATFDIDFESFDTMLFLYDSNSNLLAVSDDNGGDPGSGSGLASYIDYTFASPGTYVIGVAQYFSFDDGGEIVGTPPSPGTFYTLHVSLDEAPVGEGTPDYYAVTLNAGETATFVLTSLTGGNVDFDLRDGTDAVLATGTSVDTNVDEVMTYTALSTGTYYVRVGGQSGVDYSLVVTRDVAFEIEDNNSFETAQDITDPGAVMGHVGPGATLYGGTRFAELFTIDLATGIGSFVGFLPGPGSTEIEYDNLTGTAFSQFPDGNFAGQAFDINTGAATGVVIADGASFNGLEYVGSTLYGTVIFFPGGPSSLYTLDPTTGASGFIGDTGFGPIAGLAYDPVAGVMYGITGGPGADAQLLTIDLATGAATVVGPTGLQAGSLQFGPDGALYAGGTGVSSGELWRIDQATGTGTLVGLTGFGPVTGLTLASGDAEDWFSITVEEGDTIAYETTTPSDGTGEFVNTLDAGLELYDPTGELVDPGSTLDDGRNESVDHVALMSGTYRLRVSSQSGTKGEYVLRPAVVPSLVAPSRIPSAESNITPAVSMPIVAASAIRGASAGHSNPQGEAADEFSMIALPPDLIAEVALAASSATKKPKKLRVTV
jgi:extracellular elastinolytic metalloproteinase